MKGLRKCLHEKPGDALLIGIKNIMLTQYPDKKISQPVMLIKYE